MKDLNLIDFITKEEALLTNSVYYYTGLKCKNNHIDKRYTNTGICYSCKKDNINKDYHKHKDRVLLCNKKSNKKNFQKVIETQKNWIKNNREKSNNIKKKYKINNRDKCLESARQYSKRMRLDNFKRLSANTSKAIWESLKGNKNRRRWESIVGYTIENLVNHLELKFKDGMTWDNYGQYWHLDHIKPLSWFDLSLEFNDAWSLNNLQPLEASINLSKCNRYIG